MIIGDGRFVDYSPFLYLSFTLVRVIRALRHSLAFDGV